MKVTRRSILKASTVSLTGGSALLLTGCGVQTVLSNLELVLSLAEEAFAVAAPLFPGIGPVLTGLINNYLNAVSTAIDQTSALIPADGVVTPAIASQIATLWVNVVLPVLPAGLPQVIANALLKIEPAIVAFLKSIGVIPPAATAATVGAPKKYTTTLKANITIAPADVSKVRKFQHRAKVLEEATKK